MLDQLDNDGSGSSDFSIAQVEIQINTVIDGGYSVAAISTEELVIFTIENSIKSRVLNILIYKNGSLMELTVGNSINSINIDVTGEITYDQSSTNIYFHITGNGTITIYSK